MHRILKPFILRRLKSDVEHELTEKIEVRVLCHLSPRQRVLYDALQKNILIKELIRYIYLVFRSTWCCCVYCHILFEYTFHVSYCRAQSYSGQSTNNIVLMNLVMQFRKVRFSLAVFVFLIIVFSAITTKRRFSITNIRACFYLSPPFFQVCNHPDIFNSREILSPFWFKTNPFIFPRLLHNSFFTSTSSQRNSIKLFYSDLNVHMPSSVERYVMYLSF